MGRLENIVRCFMPYKLDKYSFLFYNYTMIKLKLVLTGDAVRLGDPELVELIRTRSPFWAEYMLRRPICSSQVFNAMCGWLMGAYPNEFELDI